MNIQTFLVGILSIALGFNLVQSIEANVACQCSCSFPISQATHRSINMPFASIQLKVDHCQTSFCVDACQQTYPICRFANGIIDGKCIQSSR